MLVVYSECVLKVGDSGHFSGLLKADTLTSATDKCMHSSVKSRLHTQNQHSLKTIFCFDRKRTSLVNKGQHISHIS